MDDYESLSHSKWECKYHVVFIPKRRRKTLYGALRKHFGEVFHRLAGQKESRIEEGHLMPDHVHILISISRSTPCRRSLGSSRAKALSIWRRCTANGRGVSWASISERVGTSSRRSVGTRTPFATTSGIKKKQMHGSTK